MRLHVSYRSIWLGGKKGGEDVRAKNPYPPASTPQFEIRKMTMILVVLCLLVVHCLADTATTANPVATATPGQFIGYRNASNTQSLRDLGFMGRLGNTWILSFGDQLGTLKRDNYDPNTGNGACQTLTGRDGGGIQSDDPLAYADINTTTIFGNCQNVPQAGYWCPLVKGDQDNEGLGITNVVDINGTHGAIWTLPTLQPGCSTPCPAGAGLAVVSFDGQGIPRCSRPFGKTTWTVNEPTWGQLGAINATTNGIEYVYVYANGYNNNKQINSVVAARVPKTQAFQLGSYEYYQGNGVWNETRIYINQLSSASPQNLGLIAGQGGIFYSNYYKRFIYITNGQGVSDGDSIYQFYAVAAQNPWGPWSNRVNLFSIDTSKQLPHYNNGLPASYGGFPMPKFFSVDGKTIYFSFTYVAFYEGVVKVLFK
ncbi:hypothetical protein PRZ48_008962 [Zasmidium cellare]|uniref:DUF4185 domain-containing protein n=1 Tax=Zasmidium cellare TaxID=395010 RepID=A0ABR0EH29_ZASCE|nr:hypothetical protein PRZ48_008962 [Zasmidium cellare]